MVIYSVHKNMIIGKKDKKRKNRLAVIGAKGIPSHVSGLEIYIQNLTTEMVDDFDITVFCRRRYCDEVLNDYKGVRIVYVPSINTKHLDAITYTIVATFMAILYNNDVFWYQALGPAVTIPVAKLFKKKIICTVHGLDWKREKFGKCARIVFRFGEKCIAKQASSIITLQRFDKEYFLKTWKRDTIMISNGVKNASFREEDEITKWGLSKDSYILFMSRIVPEKGVHTLIEAYNESGINKKLVIAGSGVHSTSYESRINKLARKNKNILFVGSVDGGIKEELYSNAYAYILPSTIEGQSIGLLEAMSYGLPCIVSNIPENIDVIGDCGLSFKVGDANSLKSVLANELSDYKKLTVLGSRAKTRIEKKFSFDGMLEATKKALYALTDV